MYPLEHVVSPQAIGWVRPEQDFVLRFQVAPGVSLTSMTANASKRLTPQDNGVIRTVFIGVGAQRPGSHHERMWMAHVGGGHALKCFPTPLESFQESWHSAFQDAHPAQLNNRPAERWVEHSFGQSDIFGSSTHVNVGGHATAGPFGHGMWLSVL